VILTDIPIGAWTTALVCDAVQWVSGRDDFASAADTAVTIGIEGALCASRFGHDRLAGCRRPSSPNWQDARYLELERNGVVRSFTDFAQAQITQYDPDTAALGYGLMTTAAHLGGEMIYTHRLGVDRTSGQVFPADFVSVLADSELAESQPKRAEHDGVPILLIRRGSNIFALAETCSHFSGPLSEGKLMGDSIQCPWHRSRFALEDGRVLDGPAVHPQPCLETRVRNGQIEVRQSPLGKPFDV
jgi:nitrite reductase/ring-hydroxylating ferredoxin subunit/uncharacterized membrane protein